MNNSFENDVAKNAGELMDRAKRIADNGLDRARKAAEGASEAAQDWIGSAIESVRKNPAPGLLCALGAGFVLGWIFKNR